MTGSGKNGTREAFRHYSAQGPCLLSREIIAAPLAAVGKTPAFILPFSMDAANAIWAR
jgi:hypothetical protein